MGEENNEKTNEVIQNLQLLLENEIPSSINDLRNQSSLKTSFSVQKILLKTSVKSIQVLCDELNNNNQNLNISNKFILSCCLFSQQISLILKISSSEDPSQFIQICEKITLSLVNIRISFDEMFDDRCDFNQNFKMQLGIWRESWRHLLYKWKLGTSLNVTQSPLAPDLSVLSCICSIISQIQMLYSLSQNIK